MHYIITLVLLFPYLALADSLFGSEGIDRPVFSSVKEFQSPLDPNYDFEAIVKLSNCSGAVIIYKSMPTSANALVLTNGHCIKKFGGYLNPGEVVTNKKQKRVVGIYNENNKLVRSRMTKLVYATMTDTDMAIYELNESYDELIRKGIRPYLLDDKRPALGTSIDIVSGYWDRGYSCHIDAFVPKLLEGAWTFTDSIRYSEYGCDTIGGTSGSPIIQAGTRVVIGVNNTGNKNGGRCGLNNPCESDESGTITVYKRSYGQQTYQVYSCLDDNFNIDLTLLDCQLPK